MDIIWIKSREIKLGQALKLAGISNSGSDAKYAIRYGTVKVNGVEEKRRGRKISDGDVVEADGNVIKIKKIK